MKCFLMFILLVVFNLPIAFAETPPAVVMIQGPSDFTLQSADLKDGMFLLAGSTGKPMNSIPTLLCADMYGAVTGQCKEKILTHRVFTATRYGWMMIQSSHCVLT